jgi:hypothetical protein
VWGPPRHVNTRNGERNVRKAPVPDNFRALWRENKNALRAAGITWDVDLSGPAPVFIGICQWTPLSAEQLAADQTAQDQSRATRWPAVGWSANRPLRPILLANHPDLKAARKSS